MRGRQRRLDRERGAGGDPLCDGDAGFERRRRGRRRDLLRDAHPVRFLCGPVVAGQHVPHRIAPACFTDETHRGAAARKAAMRVLVLPETRIRRGHTDLPSSRNREVESHFHRQ